MNKYKINVMKWNLEKYDSTPTFYQKYQILLLMENANTHLVSVFKDYLLYDDTTEFLKDYYKKKEIEKTLKPIFEYYESSSYLFPNYTALNEGKYIYRNIIKKQKLIDYLEDLEDKKKEKEEKKNMKNNNKDNDEQSSSYIDVFDTQIYHNIIKETGDDSKINDLFCVGNKNNNDYSDSIGSILKLTEEIKDNKYKKTEKEKENKKNKEQKEIIERKNKKSNKEIFINLNNNNSNTTSNINLKNINKKIKNRIESKIYVSKRIGINQNKSNSKKIFKKPKLNINMNNLLNNNLSNFNSKNIYTNDSNKNQILNTYNCKSNEYFKNNINNINTCKNKNIYKKNNIIINIINNNKINNINSNINYYSNYSNQNDNITSDNRNYYITTVNSKYNSINNKKNTLYNNRTKNNSLIKDKNELQSVIIKFSQNQGKKIIKKTKKDSKSKLLSFRFTTEINLTDRTKNGQSQSNQSKIGKTLSKNKTLITPKNNVKKRTKTEFLGMKNDIFLFGQQNENNSYNCNKSINRQILKNINLTNTNKTRKDISLVNKRKYNYHFCINSSRVEKKSMKHISTYSENLNYTKKVNMVSPLPLKEIIKKKAGILSFNNTERTSRNHSKEQINKNNTMIKRSYLDSFSPKKSQEIIYRKIKRIHNKNSAILCSYFKNVGSNKKIKGLKFNRNNNSNGHYKGISSIFNSKDKLNKISKG